VREISAACASTGIIWATNFPRAEALIDFGTEAQKERLLPRAPRGRWVRWRSPSPDAGSDATHMTTRFTPDGQRHGRRLGRKTFISNGDVADLLLVFGKWSEIADPRQAIRRSSSRRAHRGSAVLRTEDKMGRRDARGATCLERREQQLQALPGLAEAGVAADAQSKASAAVEARGGPSCPRCAGRRAPVCPSR